MEASAKKLLAEEKQWEKEEEVARKKSEEDKRKKEEAIKEKIAEIERAMTQYILNQEQEVQYQEWFTK